MVPSGVGGGGTGPPIEQRMPREYLAGEPRARGPAGTRGPAGDSLDPAGDPSAFLPGAPQNATRKRRGPGGWCRGE